MSTDAAYLANPTLPVLSHWDNPIMVAGDYISVDAQKIDRQIESGEYFMKLATTLEVLSQRPAHQAAATNDELERIANELLYLQHYYEISKKKSSHTDGK